MLTCIILDTSNYIPLGCGWPSLYNRQLALVMPWLGWAGLGWARDGQILGLVHLHSPNLNAGQVVRRVF